MNQGWECPRCHCCWSPKIKKCKKCMPPKSALVWGPVEEVAWAKAEALKSAVYNFNGERIGQVGA